MICQDGISYPLPTSTTTSINEFVQDNSYLNTNPNPNANPDSSFSGTKRKRIPGNPDPDAEVVALSPRSLMATNRFICEVCNKGFQREQNLQLHRRGHNLPWKLKQKANKEQVRKKVYVCPEKSCVHHEPSRALGDLTGIKKHFSRKHGEKKWKCDKCSKRYAVMSDWKAHTKICGTREYKCDCGTIFSRKDSFTTHRAFCDALAEERMRVSTNISAASFRADLINASLISTPQSLAGISPFSTSHHKPEFQSFEPSSGATSNIVDGLMNKQRLPLWLDLDHHHHHHHHHGLPEFPPANLNLFSTPSSSISHGPYPKDIENESKQQNYPQSLISLYSPSPAVGSMSATALLQKAALIGSTRSANSSAVFASGDGGLHQVNNQLAFEQQGYSTADQLMMMGAALTDSYDGTTMRQQHGSKMRDFLGTLGGAGAGNSNGNGCWGS